MRSRQFGTYEFLRLALILDLDIGLSSLVEDLEGEVFDVRLDFSVIIFSPD
jgi:hypothetical protein